MMEEYVFTETSSRNITIDGVQMRTVNFRGTDEESVPNERLNVDGTFTMPLMDYFQAGVDGRLSEVIRDKVIERLSHDEE